MDPFLENRWGDVHTSLTTYTRDQLQPQLPAGLYARIEEFRTTAEEVKSRIPAWDGDLRIDRWVCVFDQARGNHAVTSIEFLAPWHKVGIRNRQEFSERHRQRMGDGVSIVQVDLLRGGKWTLSIPQWSIPEDSRASYSACVIRAKDPTKAYYWPISVRSRLPVIFVPQREAGPDATLDIQKLIDDAWRDGGYSNLNHTRGPLPPFDDDDAEWVRERLREYLKSG
jgi:hypothetical protein